LKVMIITYDIGPVGLNLHKACDFVILCAPGRNWSQEAQAFGRCLPVCSLIKGSMDLTNVWI
jgi:SNF2 family DNA or RNA helicase